MIRGLEQHLGEPKALGIRDPDNAYHFVAFVDDRSAECRDHCAIFARRVAKGRLQPARHRDIRNVAQPGLRAAADPRWIDKMYLSQLRRRISENSSSMLLRPLTKDHM
jgi:hypothetical protein